MFSPDVFLCYCWRLLTQYSCIFIFYVMKHILSTYNIILPHFHSRIAICFAEDTGGMRVKRKRMPSEKFMDFETENIKKPPSKSKP